MRHREPFSESWRAANGPRDVLGERLSTAYANESDRTEAEQSVK